VASTRTSSITTSGAPGSDGTIAAAVGRVLMMRATPDERIDVRCGPAESPGSPTVTLRVTGAITDDGGLDLPDGHADPVPTWDEIATKYGRKVYTMAYRLTGDPEEAKDLSQDVFVRVYRNLDKYEPGTFEGWLYRITKNLFLDRVRRRKRVRMEPLPDEEWKQPEEEEPGPAERLEAGVLRGDIEEAITELPPDFRTAVVMCDVQGLTYEEIADATGWPLGTVRSRIHRGRKLLRKALTPAPVPGAQHA
jgi:RNA polymerase sigma-70 factor (ECF subfamily)